jgi:hypothetical protein
MKMNNEALSKFVEQVLADGDKKFGPDADPIWLEGYAREAVLNLWLEMPEITWFTAYKAYLLLRKAIATRVADDQRDGQIDDLSQLGDCACAGEAKTLPDTSDDEEREWFLDIA